MLETLIALKFFGILSGKYVDLKYFSRETGQSENPRVSRHGLEREIRRIKATRVPVSIATIKVSRRWSRTNITGRGQD